MGGSTGLANIGRRLLAGLLAIILVGAGAGCAKPTAPQALLSEPSSQPNRLGGQLEEVSPPDTLQTLKQIIDAYEPQVRILSPRPGEVVEDTSVAVRFQVRGLPLFKSAQWGLGPHLQLFVDDQPYQSVYDLSEPVVLSDLAPGTHTLRVFAARPWNESFKNQGAFDQRTFHVFAQTPQKALDKNQPLLTYSQPQGSYGAEPILLDFYLTNAPLHLIAQEDGQDAIADWRIRCTINGQSFVFDQWQPVYLTGFKPGQNWVQLELIDETGALIDNAFNNTVRVITYEPGGDDPLSQLIRDELDLQAVASIIDPTYTPPAPPTPIEPEPEPTELEPTELEPTELEPAELEPTEPEPTEPKTMAPEPEVQPKSQDEGIPRDETAPVPTAEPDEPSAPAAAPPEEEPTAPKLPTTLEAPSAPVPEPSITPEAMPEAAPEADPAVKAADPAALDLGAPDLEPPDLELPDLEPPDLEPDPDAAESDVSPAPAPEPEPEAAVADDDLPSELAPELPAVASPAPSSQPAPATNRFFKQFQRWRQEQKQDAQPDALEALPLEPMPELAPEPAPEPPEPKAPALTEPPAAESAEPEPPSTTPVSPEQLLI